MFVSEVRVYKVVSLRGVEVFQKQQPRTLLGVVQLAGTTGLFPEDIVDVFESLFKHSNTLPPQLRVTLCGRAPARTGDLHDVNVTL